MKFHKIIEERKSIREFKEKTIENDQIYELQEHFYKLEPLIEGIDLTFNFIEDGHNIHEHLLGYAGYHGMAIDAPHYLVITSEKREGYIKNAGYIMEQLLLKAFELGIGSCWIDVVEDRKSLKDKLKIDKPGEIVAMAALGYPKKNMFGIETSVSERQSIEELVFIEKWGESINLDDLRQRGLEEIFYYIRHAPSWGNVQPWRFILDNDRLILAMLSSELYQRDYSIDKDLDLDCGIIMLYIEKMMHKQGIKGKWNLDFKDIHKSTYNIPEHTVIKGWFPI